jgi:hypothetical protein
MYERRIASVRSSRARPASADQCALEVLNVGFCNEIRWFAPLAQW